MIITTAPFLLGSKTRAMTIFPFIFIKEDKLKYDKVLINHEMIHIKQQIETLWLPFFIWYLLEYMIRLFKLKSPNKAYRNICFEQEAYSNQGNLNYLKNRKKYNWIKYYI